MKDSKIIFLDHAAATPLDKKVLVAMMPYLTDSFYNPSSPYLPAVETKRAYQAAKQMVASLLGAKASELIITAGATESINLAFNNITGQVVTSEIEHPAVLACAKNKSLKLVKADQFGYIKADLIKQAINDQTEIISLGLANNELGTVQPISKIASLVKEERARRLKLGIAQPILLHCDASQGVGLLDINVARLGVDMLTINAGKIYGPKQVGLLWVNSNVKLKPLIVGGGQENGLRSGTENVAGVVGLAKALELASQHRLYQAKYLKALRDKMQKALLIAFPDMVVSNHKKYCLPNFLHLAFPGLDGERLVFLLEAKGVMVSTGSACAASKGSGSHVLKAIGLKPDLAGGSIRITLGQLNNDVNIDKATNIIIDVVKAEYGRVGQ